MVIRRNMMRRNLRRTIVRSLGRYLAIMAIIALGCALFVGLRGTKTDMVATGQHYTDRQNMFDLRLLSSYGWNKADVETVAKMEGVVDAEGSITLDVYGRLGSGEKDVVYRLHSLPKTVSKPYLLGGRMPQAENECLIDGVHLDGSVLGMELTVSTANEQDTLESLEVKTYTVVGYVSSPLYMDMTRGNTTLGNGSVSSYVYIPEEAFAVDYYTEINITIPGDWKVYSEAYTAAMDAMAEKVEPLLVPVAQERFDTVKQEALELYADGVKEYEDGVREFEEAKAEALAELADALKQLEDGQKQLDEGWEAYRKGEQELADTEKLLQENADKLAQGRIDLETAKKNTYAQLQTSYDDLVAKEKEAKNALKQIEEGLPLITDGLTQIADGLAQIEEGLPQLELAITLAEAQVSAAETALRMAERTGNENLITTAQTNLDTARKDLEGYQSQRQEVVKTREDLLRKQQELTKQKEEMETGKVTLEAALPQIADGFRQIESGRLQADSEFAAAEAELLAGEKELEKGRRELESGKTKLSESKAELEKAQAELDKGWKDYESGKAEADTELADAQKKLDDAKLELDDAKKTIEEMDSPELYVLTRNTNMGYMALDSNSDIVSGISLVLPVFFVLIAALVCITTMTRMVEEERTQIGTLKALGHSGYSIMGKYLIYSASASVIGCGLGVAAGSTFLPQILWGAYSIIFNITPELSLVFDWQLSVGVTAAYTLVSSLVTWYSCHRTLREVPAELIRPKPPTSGKKILLEYLPFWEKLSFLNKVMLRNVLRYRQRLLMMLVGIGGCTALLLTGFGLRDTIVDVANIQFAEVLKYDIEVYFSGHQTEQMQSDFRDALGDAQKVGFFHQSSVELNYGGRTWDVAMIAGDDSVAEFIDFHSGDKQLKMPASGEALVSTGVCEALGVAVGDTVTVRDTQMRELELTVSGIYDNHVNNYVVVRPETVQAQWGELPEYQMAFVTVKNGADIHATGAAISALEGVMSISVSEDLADMVNSMMDALDMVVAVIIVSAGLLAAIVLYNLTNININERIREIATIKVLGFNSKETSAYVFKENILLTVLGAAGGLVLGKYFLDFVMSQVKIDMVWFATRLAVPSYIYAVVLTLLCAAAVDFIFHKKLETINMAEALKSVE